MQVTLTQKHSGCKCPIYDYPCHVPTNQVKQNQQYPNISNTEYYFDKSSLVDKELCIKTAKSYPSYKITTA